MAVGDNVAATNKLKSFQNADYNFPSSRECLFIQQLLQVSYNNNNMFTSTSYCCCPCCCE